MPPQKAAAVSCAIFQVFLTQLDATKELELPSATPMTSQQPMRISYVMLAACACAVVLLALIVNKVYVYTEMQQIRRIRNHAKHGAKASGPRDSDVSVKPKLGMLVLYVILKLMYCLIFTFTTFSIAVSFFMQSELTQLGNLTHFVSDAQNRRHALSADYDAHWRVELLHEAELVTSMQSACSHYVTELFDTMLERMNNATSADGRRRLIASNETLSELMYQRHLALLRSYQANMTQFTDAFFAKVDASLTPAIKKYRDFIGSVYSNEWLSFGQRLFNDSGFHGNSARRETQVRDALLTGKEVDFGLFIGLEEIEDVRLWKMQLQERYRTAVFIANNIHCSHSLTILFHRKHIHVHTM